MKAKKLIEVALPIKEISAESVRDKSIRHGHISTLHLWWARRPLPVCRAIVFASLVPDPLDDNCPQAFREAVMSLLSPDKDDYTNKLYRPYGDIPYTAIYDPMVDNLRNRLLMFIGKFSELCQANMKAGKNTSPKEQLSDGSLIKWENKNNPKILRMARELIWVAYNAEKQPTLGYETLHKKFDESFDAITCAEDALYSVVDRHIKTAQTELLEKDLQQAIDTFQSQMPSVFDPFAGGGAIPLEAARLGCRSYGNDINPVAHIIERGTAEFPQKYGKPIVYSEDEFISKYGDEGLKMAQESDRNIIRDSKGFHIPNRLSFDVEYYAKRLLAMTEKEVGYLYPADEKGDKPVAYYWARTAKCSNPSCQAEVPMLKSFYLCNKPNKKVYLNPIIKDKSIDFEIEEGTCNSVGWNNRGNLSCPCCGSITSVAQVKSQFRDKTTGERMLAVIEENTSGKNYRTPFDYEYKILDYVPTDSERPNAKMEVKNTRNFNTPGWGFDNYGEIFSNRQITTINSFISNYLKIKSEIQDNVYNQVLLTYLSIWIDRICVANTSLGVWHTGGEKLERIMGRQAIPMTFDYPESNPFCNSSGSAVNQLDWIILYIENESRFQFYANFLNASSGEKTQFSYKSLNAVVTDPPYYDAIAYADISDFFMFG
jgi:putative DNA methylase